MKLAVFIAATNLVVYAECKIPRNSLVPWLGVTHNQIALSYLNSRQMVPLVIHFHSLTGYRPMTLLVGSSDP